jgi:hypothetical protein
MAAKTLDEAIASLSAEEKKLFENTLSKNPDLKAGWMTQADYSRKTQELATERQKMQDDLDYADKMKTWADVNVPKWDALVEKGLISEDGEELWSTQKTEMERQLQEARNAQVGGEMTAEELDKRVKEIVKATGVTLTKEEISALYASEAKSIAESTFTEQWKAKETDFNEKTIPFVAGFSTANAVAAMEYQTQTGKPWTAEVQREFNALMVKENNYDPYAVKEIFLKPFKDAKENDAEVERKAQERADAILKERGLMPGGGNETYIPQSSEKGNLQTMLERSAGEGDFESVIAAQAVKAAKELSTVGK